MINWTERAKAALAQTGQGGTATTDETAISRLLAVSAVSTVADSSTPERLSSVSAVPPPSRIGKTRFFHCSDRRLRPLVLAELIGNEQRRD